MLFGTTANESIDGELRYVSQVDRAHLVMLAEQGLIERAPARRLLTTISELAANGFAPLHGKVAIRGLFLLYEDYLIQQLGVETGGILHTARSRNDLNATTLRLRLREPYLKLLRETLRLQAALIGRARRFSAVVMPAYTHYQAAVPITYGHYLAGIASALERDIASLLEGGAGLNHCPLGAGAVGGTSLPINPARTAALLGFDHAVTHSIDAVASRDFILRLLASASICGITLSRLAGDLLLWTTAEFGFLTLPDQLVGSSSMMPQKRNPFLLEHVQGRGGSALGAFVNAATAMHAKPFTNSISVGTEGVAPVWDALRNLTEATTLARLVVSGAVPQPSPMLRTAATGYTSATELANRLAVEHGLPFRSAHHIAGTIISDAIANNDEPLEDAVARWQATQPREISLEGLDPASVVQASIYGGGPGDISLRACLDELKTNWTAHMRRKQQLAEKWNAAELALNEAARELCL
jgi:argininosuccinate lyase